MRDTMTSVHTNIIYKEIEEQVLEEIEKVFASVPFTKEFHEGKVTDREYYKRHILESIIRIGLNNEVDAYCIHKIACQDKLIAQKLLNYLAEEYSHDNFFINDLAEFGIDKEQIMNTEPLFSTQLLLGYLYYSINKDGPIPTIVWNWLVEWYSKQYNTNVTMKAKEEFGIKKVKGMIDHIKIDQTESHAQDMFYLLKILLKEKENQEKVKQYITNFIKLIGMYFQELYDTTIATKL